MAEPTYRIVTVKGQPQVQVWQNNSRGVPAWFPLPDTDPFAKKVLTAQNNPAATAPPPATMGDTKATVNAPVAPTTPTPGTVLHQQVLAPTPPPPKVAPAKVTWGGPGSGRVTTTSLQAQGKIETPKPTPDPVTPPPVPVKLPNSQGHVPKPPATPNPTPATTAPKVEPVKLPNSQGHVPTPTATPAPAPEVKPVQVPMPKEPETLIADQDPTNPLSNARALERSVAQDYRPIMPTTADVANSAKGYGLGDYTDTSKLAEDAVRVANAQADQLYSDEKRGFLNQYEGLGVTGNKIRRAQEMAGKYSTSKAATEEAIRRQFNELGFGRNLEVNDRATGLLQGNQGVNEGRYTQAVNSAENQNRLAVETLQQERGRFHDKDLVDQRARYDQYALDQAAKGDLQSEMFKMLGDMINPPQPSATDQWIQQQIAMNGGMAPQPYQPQGLNNILNPLQGLLQQVGGATGLDLGQMVQFLPMLQQGGFQ